MRLFYLLFDLFGPFVSIIFTLFWIWMLYECIQNDGDRNWVWLLIFLNFIGAFLYFVICYLPRHPLPQPKFMGQWTKKEKIWQAEADAKNIGKAYQYVKLGEVLYEVGQRERANHAYQEALKQEPENAKALWGVVTIALDRKNFQTAREHLEILVKKEPGFLYGDMSATYGRVLFELEALDQAQAHLEDHVRQWSHPESYVLLAQIYKKQGETPKAREALETMLAKVKSSPPYHYRKNRKYIGQGEKLLRGLGRD
jgi:hypothetical protein